MKREIERYNELREKINKILQLDNKYSDFRVIIFHEDVKFINIIKNE